MLSQNNSRRRRLATALLAPIIASLATLVGAGQAAGIGACAEHVYAFQTTFNGRTVGPMIDTRGPGGFDLNTRDFTNNWITLGGETLPRRPATFYFRRENGEQVQAWTTSNSDDGGVIRQEKNVHYWSIAEPGEKLFVYADFHTRCGGGDVIWYNQFVGTIMTYPSLPVEINPKFVVLSVQYAPPGAGSSVDYGQSTTVGSRISFNNSFQGGVTVTNVNPVNEFLSISTSAGFTQRATIGGSDAVEKAQSSTVVIPGPASSVEGISHDSDLIEVWLNPRFTMTSTSPMTVESSGFSADPRDPVPGMDTLRLSVRQLKDRAFPAGAASRLERSWSPTGGLAPEDFDTILARDPFARGETTIDPARFNLIQGVNFDYEPADPGSQPVTERFGVRTTASSASAQSFTTTVKVDKTVTTTTLTDPNPRIVELDGKLKNEHSVNRSFEVSYSLNLDQTNTASQSTNVSITGPSSGYQGPTALRLYQDNLFGTVMFAFAPVATFEVGTPGPNQTVTQGGTAAYPITTQSDFGFAGNVNFEPTVTGLPAGAQASFSPTSVGVGGGSTLNVTTTPQTPPGSYPLTFTASSNLIHRHSTVNLVVRPLPFTLTAAPSSRTVAVGNTTTYTVNVTPIPGFGDPVTLSGPAGLPPGTTASFNPRVLDTGSGTSTLTITTSASTPSRTSTLTITGTGGNATVRTAVTLVTDANQDFGLGVTPEAAGVETGGTAEYTVTTTPISGFNGDVNLTVSGLPPGATPSFTANPITGAGSSIMRIATTASTPPGDYELTVTGSSVTRNHSQIVTMSVSDFTLAPSPTTRSAIPGDSTTFAVSTTALAGHTGDIGLSVTGLPTGATGNFDATPVSPGSGSTLTVQVNSNTPAGNYPLTITGTSGGASHSEDVLLTVTPPEPGLTLKLGQDSLTIVRGGTGMVSVLASGLGDFVNLRATNLPTGATATFDANPINVDSTTYLNIGIPPGTKPSTYTITVTATSGNHTDRQTLALTVI